MRTKTILPLCCLLTLLLAGAAVAAETGPALTLPGFDNAAPAPVCSVPLPQDAQADLGGGPVTESACPVSVWQACYQRYGTCMLCFCLGSSCECENRCV
jgi:hypothetical protein